MSLPFEGLPVAWMVLFDLALAVIVAMLAWTALLLVRGARARRNAPEPRENACDDFMWIFLVPALNEEITIRDSVERLLAIPLARRAIVIVDDGSDDRTPGILRELAHPDIHVLRRLPPHARTGKAAALNHAYRALDGLVGDIDRERTVVVVVDADGRLHPTAPHFAAAQFDDPRVGGVQALVRIYNRRRPLTWAQDVEFSVYGHLFQAGRNDWGTAGMGGSGQFNRLSALDAIADRRGPWRDRLTEDQDLGLRLIAAGWRCRQELRAVVDQQGPPSLRPLFRQRTRWAQGNLQALRLMTAVWRAPLPLSARIEQVAYLLMPLWQGIVGAAFVGAVVLAATGVSAFWVAGPWWQLLLIYLLGFGGTIIGCVASRAPMRPRSVATGLLIAQVYAFYSWLLWPVLLRAGLRQVVKRNDWARTKREPLGPPAPGGVKSPSLAQ